MEMSYAARLGRMAAELDARPELRVQIWWGEVDSFACIRCTDACTRPWKIAITRDYHARWAGPLTELTGLSDAELFVRESADDDRHFAALAKKPGSSVCIMLDEQGLCRIHSRWGPEAKPGVCQMYPFIALPADRVGFDGLGLSLSCTQAGRMLMQPQELFFRLISAGGPPRQAHLSLAPGRELSRSAWLSWLGHSLDALLAAPDFGAWLGMLGEELGRLLRVPAGLISADAIRPFELSLRPQPMSPSERGRLLQWFETTVLGIHPAFAEMLPWLAQMRAEPERLSLPAAEASQLETFLRAYWLRQLLVPAHLLRGELNLVQQMLFTGFQGSLIRLRAIWLWHRHGRLGVEELAAAGNQVYAFIAQDHASEACQPFRHLRLEICLVQLMMLSRWR